MKRTWNYKFGIAIAVIALLAYVTFLLFSNYLSQKNLQQTLLDQFRLENETHASVVSYFFADRRKDLKNLTRSREVDVFFENRALGMSMEYGLKQSLPPIRNLFASLIERTATGRDHAYLKIMMLDQRGNLLVEVAEPGQEPKPTVDRKKYVSSEYPNGTVIADDADRSIAISTSYFFKGRHAGQIIAWLNPAYLAGHVVKPHGNPEWKKSLLSTDRSVYIPAGQSMPSAFPKKISDAPQRFREREPGKKSVDMIGRAAVVKDTPFLLVCRAPAAPVLGELDSERLLMGMALLALVIIGGGLAMVKVMTRSVLLKAMLDTSLSHEQNGREKNRQLEKEITERKHAEDELRDSEARYRTLVDNSPDVIFTLSFGDGIIRSINPVFEKITGWPREEWIGKSFLDIVHPDDRALALEKHKEASNGAGVLRYDIRCLTKSGAYRVTELTTAPLVQHGIAGGRLGIARDITERTVLEEQLRHAVKMKAIGQLAGGIAHDFNNILSVVIGACDLVLFDIEEGHRMRPKIQMIQTSAERGAQLTRNLLTFSRKQLIRMAPGDLNEIVRTSEPLIARLLREDIRFSLDLTPGTLRCLADVTQMEQALMNLAANARDAMTGSGRFTISSGSIYMDETFRREHGFGQDGEYAVLRVQDTGIGMDEETRQRVFEPFFTTKDVGRGTGLGLSTVFGIVKQHNGFIDVKSEVGKGSVFFIYLPLISERRDSEAMDKPAERRDRGSGTILVAEDENQVRDIIKQILERSGYRVIEACDGDEAEAKFLRYRDEIDLLILDVIMPKKNGKQAYDAIKQVRPKLKCLFLSGYTADIISSSGISEKESAFLQKPVPPQVLLSKVREMLGAVPIP